MKLMFGIQDLSADLTHEIDKYKTIFCVASSAMLY